ncbi:MAG TPA: hemolysin family protein [Streptosporangiaceae bacterium]|nr:hemolysin family protein [Streptosporangiaceae bacterium]
MGWLIVAAALLVLFAGLCASADTALLRVSRAGAKELASSAGEASAPLQAVLAEVPKYIAVLLLARIAAELAATVMVTAALVSWLGHGWRPYLITGAVMAAVIYVVVGIVPRTLGREYAASVADSAASIMQPIVRLMGPVPAMLLAVGRVLGRDGASQNGPSGEEEDLRGLVDLLERRRVIEPGERAMIHSVFELGDTIVREVMVPRTDMIYVESGKTLRQAMSLALRSGFSRIPVVGQNLDDVVGIAYLKDIVRRTYDYADGLATETVSSIMRPATFVPDSKPVDDLLREMQARQIHVAIVIDEYGGTAGLATIEDILEEIVGEIADEYDQEQPPVEWLGPEHARVTARLSVDELAELFGVRIEAEDVETVGGLLAQRLGRVPIAGSTATVAGLKLAAESLAGRRNRISTVTVRRIRGAGAKRAQQEAEPEEQADHAGRGAQRGTPPEGATEPGTSPAASANGATSRDDQLAWAAGDEPGSPASELADRAADLERDQPDSR